VSSSLTRENCHAAAQKAHLKLKSRLSNPISASVHQSSWSLCRLYARSTKSVSFPYLSLPTCIEAPHHLEGVSMFDLLMLAIGFVLFALTIGYAVACDRL
jgi:hypothetical protein